MSGTKVKICGLRFPEDIQAANRFRPDYVGFLFVPGRRRSVSLSDAARLKSHLHPSVKSVGVFLDAGIDTVVETAELGVIDLIQLHGNEDNTYIELLRNRLRKKQLSLPVIKAFGISDESSFRAAMSSNADYLLLDNRDPGSGQAFDWSLLQTFNRPYFLAGGLSPDNLEEALKNRPYAVDVSSGVETDGKKDPEKIRRFIELTRKAEA